MKASSLRGDLGLLRGCSGEGLRIHPGPLQDTALGDSALAGLRPGRFWWDLLGGERDWGRWKRGGRLPPPPKPGDSGSCRQTCERSGSEHFGGERAGHLQRAEEPQEDECYLGRQQ